MRGTRADVLVISGELRSTEIREIYTPSYTYGQFISIYKQTIMAVALRIIYSYGVKTSMITRARARASRLYLRKKKMTRMVLYTGSFVFRLHRELIINVYISRKRRVYILTSNIYIKYASAQLYSRER